MSHFIDRRPNNRNKSAVNRRRFLQRFKRQIKDSVSNAVTNRSISDFEHGDKIDIPTRDTCEPTFAHGCGDSISVVLPGNKEFCKGDKIKKPEEGQAAQGTQASNTGDGEDSFIFEVSREEFLDIFFDDLQLPNLLRKEIGQTQALSRVRAGHTKEGVPTNINIPRTFKNALARRIALTKKTKREIKETEKELINARGVKKKAALEQTLDELNHRVSKVPFIDPFDLKYNRKVTELRPSTKAVVFCIMDVSGSMDEAKKDMSKRFFILLYLFLTRTYETIDIIFIRHHTSAKEVNEQDFFYSRETGGTVVSSALELMNDIINDRYSPDEWNIYGAQASDGDNWNNDSPRCRELLMDNIMPRVQYFAYVEIMPRHHQSLWEEYTGIEHAYPNFQMQSIEESKDIYRVFRKLFQKEEVKENG